MRAAILHSVGGEPEVGSFDDPTPRDGHVVLDVSLAGVNPIDIRLASGQLGAPRVPSVVGLESVGTLDDGSRVYCGASIPPFGSWAQRTLIDAERAFPVPEAIDDGLAVALGISGVAAWLPLAHHAKVQPGESVLVLGATGTVGRIAVQAAELLGAGRVVAAARDAAALGEVEGLGADAAVVLGQGDDAQALRAAAGDGFDVVIDPVYGAPFEAALGATRVGARLVTIGESAGPEAVVSFRALQGRTHIAHGNGHLAFELVRDAYAKLTELAAAGRITVPIERFSIDDAADAWRAQAHGPRCKLVVEP
ncbi:MAG TPA: zinc-binding alcohol dehydrogenase family protein [Solirubrobacteraceae bacterium]|jgi:NADPH2:quinone reductase